MQEECMGGDIIGTRSNLHVEITDYAVSGNCTARLV
jgi:hypothetical protein